MGSGLMGLWIVGVFCVAGAGCSVNQPPHEHTHLHRFNIDEFLDLEKIDRGVTTIIVNGNLDRVRGGYYPR